MTRNTLLALALACPFAAPAQSSADATHQVAVFKFGIELGCRDQGAGNGDSRAKIDLVCGCMTRSLDLQIPPDDWKRAAKFAFERNRPEEDRVMQPYYRSAAASCRKSIADPKDAAQQPEGLPNLTGKWTWTTNRNCTEVYELKADGTAKIASGEEITSNVYLLSAPPDSPVRYKLTITTQNGNGKPDCSGAKDSAIVQTASRFIYVNYAVDRMLMCDTVTGKACIGPLVRELGR